MLPSIPKNISTLSCLATFSLDFRGASLWKPYCSAAKSRSLQRLLRLRPANGPCGNTLAAITQKKSATQTLATRQGHLAMHWGQDPFWRDMVMTDGDTFFLRSDYATIHFERGPEGAVRRMVWTWPGGAHLSFDKDQILESNAPAAPENP